MPQILRDAIGVFFDPDHWTRFVAAFGDPTRALIAIGVLCTTFVTVVGMMIWWSLAKRRLKLAEQEALLRFNINVTRELRIFGLRIYERTTKRT